MDTLGIMLGFLFDLFVVWAPFVGSLVVLVGLGLFAHRTQRIARANARIRAERRAREAYRAPVLDLTHRLPSQHSHTA